MTFVSPTSSASPPARAPEAEWLDMFPLDSLYFVAGMGGSAIARPVVRSLDACTPAPGVPPSSKLTSARRTGVCAQVAKPTDWKSAEVNPPSSRTTPPSTPPGHGGAPLPANGTGGGGPPAAEPRVMLPYPPGDPRNEEYMAQLQSQQRQASMGRGHVTTPLGRLTLRSDAGIDPKSNESHFFGAGAVMVSDSHVVHHGNTGPSDIRKYGNFIQKGQGGRPGRPENPGVMNL